MRLKNQSLIFSNQILQQKVMLSLKCAIEKQDIKTGEVVFNLPFFCSDIEVNLESTDVNDLYQKMADNILEKVVSYNKGGSNLIFKQILSLEIHTVLYESLGGSSYIPLPPELCNRKAIINLKNKDNQSFKWIVTRASNMVYINPEHIDTKLIKSTKKYNWDGITFPVNLGQIDRFEKQNPVISVNVFGYEKKNVTILRKRKTYKRENIVDLLINEVEVQHYCAIKNLSRLISSQHDKHHGKKYPCRGFLNIFNFEDTLNKHIEQWFSTFFMLGSPWLCLRMLGPPPFSVFLGLISILPV